jgi:hypothetical protein
MEGGVAILLKGLVREGCFSLQFCNGGLLVLLTLRSWREISDCNYVIGGVAV